MNLKNVYQEVKKTFPNIIVNGNLLNLKWFFDWNEVTDNVKDFDIDLETILEFDENIFDENVKITKEICFESEDSIFCHIYTDDNFNINRMFLNKN